MHWRLRPAAERLVHRFFKKYKDPSTEEMYQAFKTRLMLEVKAEGGGANPFSITSTLTNGDYDFTKDVRDTKDIIDE